MPTIMIIEDDDLVLETTTELLEIKGYEILGATSGKAALAILGDPGLPKIKLILLDLSLPDTNGIDLLPDLLAIEPQLKIIICSGTILDEETTNKLARQGVKDFLPKPYNFQRLIDLVKEALAD